MQAVQHRPLHKVPYRQSSLTVPLKSSGESPTINTSSRDHALMALCLCPAGTQLLPWEKPTWLSYLPWDLILIRFWSTITKKLAALQNSQILISAALLGISIYFKFSNIITCWGNTSWLYEENDDDYQNDVDDQNDDDVQNDDDDRNDVASNEVPTTSTCQLKLESSPNDTEES